MTGTQSRPTKVSPQRTGRGRRALMARHPRSDPGTAFIRDPEGGAANTRDSLAENLAEIYLESATSGEEQAEDVLNQFVLEDAGGPFIDEPEGDAEGGATDHKPQRRARIPPPRGGARRA